MKAGRRLLRRFSLVSVVAVAALTIAGAPTASAQEQLAASCEPPGTLQTTNEAVDEAFGQGFTSSLSGALTRAQFDVFKSGGSGNWDVQIRTVDPDGLFTDVVLASATVLDADVPAGRSVLTGVFASPATVVAGGQYAVVVIRPGAVVGTYGPGFFNDDRCPGRAWDSAGPGMPGADIDFPFRAFVTPPVPTPMATCKGKPATIVGTEGNDKLSGTAAADVIAALGGSDKVSGAAGNDRICGGTGKDALTGGKGNDKLYGEAGKDTLKGGPGNDKLKGGAGKDKQVQ
jgi:Ca2+-binding RTX toxin-like protein